MPPAELAIPIRVLIVDDQSLLRDGFSRLLEMEPGIQIVGTAQDGHDALDTIARLTQSGLAPSVALMDVRMPRMDGVAATAAIAARFPEVRVIMLTTFDDVEYIVAGLRAGAKGYLLKDSTLADLVEAIKSVYRGDVLLQPSVAAKLVDRLVSDPAPATPAGPRDIEQVMIDELTEREREILALVARGASNREISEKLFITEGTVKNHVSNILTKLELRDRTQAAIFAREHGLGG